LKPKAALLLKHVMVITLTPEIESALNKSAQQQGLKPEELALNALRDRFVGPRVFDEPRDEWERRLRSIPTDCGGRLTNESLRRENMYD
jgi:hypothetical protein